VFALNVDKQAGRIAGFSLAILIAVAVVLVAPGRGQTQTEDYIVNLVSSSSGKCLQPIQQSHNQGDAIVQQTCNGSAAQQWTVHEVSGTTLHLIDKDSGLCLDARGKAADGTPIQQWPCNKITNEDWRLGTTGDLLVSGISNSWSHCIAAGGTQDGLPMVLSQCNGSPAQLWKIPHAVSAACSGSSGTSPLDLVWSNCDQNGFPFNPELKYQASNDAQLTPSPTSLCPAASSSHIFPASCISFPVTYDSGFWCGPHVNYFAVTYQGAVYWLDKSAWGTDSDYNFNMIPPGGAGVVGLTSKAILIEFDSEETINYFQSKLWTDFHHMVDNDNSAAQAYIHGQTAVVTSLFGLDCAHSSCGSEEHPAYAMAVNMDDSNPSDDQWGVFARNWGDEGFCGSQEHTLPGGDLKLVIPWLAGATAVAVLPTSKFNLFQNSPSAGLFTDPQITVANGEGILIDFSLPDPSLQTGWEGEIHLQWTVPPPALSALKARTAARHTTTVALSAEGEQDEKEKAESRIGALLTSLPAEQQAALRSQLTASSAAAPPAAARPSKPLRPVLKVAKLPDPPRQAPVVPKAVTNPRLAQRDSARRQALCQAYKDNVPGYPSACAAGAAVP
jgi:hypothetical protein